MKMIKILLVATAIAGAISASPALAGTTITGSLQFNPGGNNYYDPANTTVPSGYGNSLTATNVAVGTGIEFGYDGGSDGGNTADFTPTSLLLTDIPFVLVGKNIDSSWTQTFTSSTPGFFDNIKTIGTPSIANLNFSVTGDTLTVTHGTFVDLSYQPETFTANFTFDGPVASAAPEPATWGMMLVGFAGTGVALRRARRKPASKVLQAA